MTDQEAAFVVILMDALTHRRDCRRIASGECSKDCSQPAWENLGPPARETS